MKYRALSIFTFACFVGSANANLLTNSDFAIVGPSGPSTVNSGALNVGWSAAQDWFVWNNTAGTSTTRLVDISNVMPPGVPSGATTAIHMTADGPQNGLVQLFGGNPNNAEFDAWVFVVSGQVGLGLGNGGSTNTTVVSSTLGQWEHLFTLNNTSPANEATIYSTVPTEYFVTSANVEAVPEPASIAAIGLGVVALIRRRRK